MRPAAAIAVVAVALAAAAAPARAADYYVTKAGLNTNPCTIGQPCGSAQGVVVKAAVVDGDVVHIAAGTYTGNTGRISTTKRLTFIGDGSLGCGNAGTTYLDAAITTVPGVTLSRGGALRSLCVRGGFGGADDVPPAAGLALTSTDPAADYELTDVDATGGAKGTTSAEALSLTDDATRTITLTMTRGSYRTPLGGTAIRASGTNVALNGTLPTIIAGSKGTGLAADSGAAVSLDQASILDAAGQATGARAFGPGSELSLTRSTISALGTAVLASSSLFNPAGAAQVTIDTSLLLVHKTADVGGGYGVRASASGAGRSASATVRSSTVIVSGPGATAALAASSVSNAPATIQATGTYVSAADTDGTPGDADLVADANTSGTATITATYSAFGDRQELDGGTATAPGTGTNVTGDPKFTDPAKDNYVPLAGSVLIDRADPAVPAPGGLDLQGLERPNDGDGNCLAAPDIGAYEASASTADCRPTIHLLARPIRLSGAGDGLVSVVCPPLSPRPCTGTLTISSVGALALTKGAPKAIETFASIPLSMAPGAAMLLPFTVTPAQNAFLRKRKGVAITIAADLDDEVYGTNTVVARTRLLPAPARPVATGGRLVVDAKGAVRVRLRCAAYELVPCTGTVSIRTRKGKLVARAVRVSVAPGARSVARLKVKRGQRPRRGHARRVRVQVVASEGTGAAQVKARTRVGGRLVRSRRATR